MHESYNFNNLVGTRERQGGHHTKTYQQLMHTRHGLSVQTGFDLAHFIARLEGCRLMSTWNLTLEKSMLNVFVSQSRRYGGIQGNPKKMQRELQRKERKTRHSFQINFLRVGFINNHGALRTFAQHLRVDLNPSKKKFTRS